MLLCAKEILESEKNVYNWQDFEIAHFIQNIQKIRKKKNNINTILAHINEVYNWKEICYSFPFINICTVTIWSPTSVVINNICNRCRLSIIEGLLRKCPIDITYI